MRKKVILIFLIGILGISLLYVFNYLNKANINKNITSSSTPYPTIISTPEINNNIKKATITPVASRNIEVVSPLIGDSVKKGFLVKGNAKTKDNMVGIRLWDSSGNVIAETTAETNSSSTDQYGPFEKLITFNTTDKSGELEIFHYNQEDGSITDTVGIDLTFN